METGATVAVQQYSFGSDDPDQWGREVVRVVELNGLTLIASVFFPEFPDPSMFANDTRNQPLTGLDPIDQLDDVRFFE